MLGRGIASWSGCSLLLLWLLELIPSAVDAIMPHSWPALFKCSVVSPMCILTLGIAIYGFGVLRKHTIVPDHPPGLLLMRYLIGEPDGNAGIPIHND